MTDVNKTIYKCFSIKYVGNSIGDKKYLKTKQLMRILMKRGQITIFIIFGIVILIILAAFFYIRSVPEEEMEVEEERAREAVLLTEPIKMYVEGCIKETIKDVLVSTGQQGGYFVLPQDSTEGMYENTAYFFREKNKLFPSREIISKELSKSFDNIFTYCLDDFEPFRQQGYTFEYDTVSSDILIQANDILIEIDFPLKITKGDSITEISSFSASSETVRLNEILNSIEAFVDEQIEDTEYICFYCIDQITEKGLTVDMTTWHNDTMIFTVTDEKSMIFDEPYKFTFAGQYKFNREI
jgi:hypothetical protein